MTETTIAYACGVHSGVASSASNHVAAGCGNSSHFICDNSEHSASSCGHLNHFNCDSLSHVEEQCTFTNSDGNRCTYTFWRCIHPNVPSYGPSHNHTYPAPTQSFSPSLSVGSSSYSPGSSLSAAVSTSGTPIYGAWLYVNGTPISWFGGSTDKSTTALSLSYTFPSDASGSYSIRVQVYQWDGNTYGTAENLYETVNVQ